MKDKVEDLRKDVDYLKYTNFTSLLKASYYVDAPTTSKILLDTTRDIHQYYTIDDESEEDTDEEKIDVWEAEDCDGFVELENSMFENSLNASLRDTTMCGSSGVGSYEGTPSIDAHVQSVTMPRQMEQLRR